MTLTRKDAVATGFTGLAVLAFVATHEAWNVPLVGDSPAPDRRRGAATADAGSSWTLMSAPSVHRR